MAIKNNIFDATSNPKKLEIFSISDGINNAIINAIPVIKENIEKDNCNFLSFTFFIIIQIANAIIITIAILKLNDILFHLLFI